MEIEEHVQFLEELFQAISLLDFFMCIVYETKVKGGHISLKLNLKRANSVSGITC